MQTKVSLSCWGQKGFLDDHTSTRNLQPIATLCSETRQSPPNNLPVIPAISVYISSVHFRAIYLNACLLNQPEWEVIPDAATPIKKDILRKWRKLIWKWRCRILSLRTVSLEHRQLSHQTALPIHSFHHWPLSIRLCGDELPTFKEQHSQKTRSSRSIHKSPYSRYWASASTTADHYKIGNYCSVFGCINGMKTFAALQTAKSRIRKCAYTYVHKEEKQQLCRAKLKQKSLRQKR